MPATPQGSTGSYTPSAYPAAFATAGTDGSYSVTLYGGSYSVTLSQNQQVMNAANGVLVEGSWTVGQDGRKQSSLHVRRC